VNQPTQVQALADSRRPVGGLSIVSGPRHPELSEQTIGRWLDHTAEALPGRTACVFRAENLRWSWVDLRDQADRLAGGLLRLGFKRGDRLGIWAPNRCEWILAQYASARIGVILVNINPAYRLTELEYALNKVECRGIITAPGFKSGDYVAMLQALAPELSRSLPGVLSSARLPHLRCVIRMGTERTPGMFGFGQVLAMGDEAAVMEARALSNALTADDPINIQFTSGTTGAPKGATLTHRNIVNNAIYVAQAMGLGQDSRLCVPVPLYHCFGMVMGSLACAVTGGAMVFPGEGFDAPATLEALDAERCTHLHGVPTMFIAMLDAPGFAACDLASLRGGIMAGSPCPIEVMKRVVSEMHMREVTIAYGMTETSPVSFQSSTDDPLELRVATVGRVQPHLEVKIVDGDGRVVPVGVAGEVATRGYSVMLGYWGDQERTVESIRDGWMHTGDLATLDENGYCNIVGRVKDMLIRGGENVYPREVEEFLFTHPAVAQAQVFGVPDSKYGEEVCAWIVLKPGVDATEATAADIRAFCRDRIAHYKIPRYLRFVGEIPMTVTGKAQKFIMREQMVAELGLNEAASA